MSAPAEVPSTPRLTVLFIGGMGRSGSTLLDRLLGQQPRCTAVGELGLLWRSGLAENRLCGCGTPLRQCDFWQAVGDAAFGGFGRLSASTLETLQAFWAQRRRFASRLVRPSGLGRTDRAALSTYSVHLARLLAGVQAVAGCEVVVDSSKTPAHLAALLAVPEIDVHVVHLVRDPRAVADSWLQRRRRLDGPGREEFFEPVPAWKTALLWSGINLALWRQRRAARSARVLRYEDFAAAPIAALAAIARQIGRTEQAPAALPSSFDLGLQHTVAGNSLRLSSGAIEVRPDRIWEERLPASTRWLVTACAWPGLLAYRYPVFAGRRPRTA